MQEREPYQEFLNGVTEGVAGCLWPILLVFVILLLLVLVMMPFFEIASLFE